MVSFVLFYLLSFLKVCESFERGCWGGEMPSICFVVCGVPGGVLRCILYSLWGG